MIAITRAGILQSGLRSFHGGRLIRSYAVDEVLADVDSTSSELIVDDRADTGPSEAAAGGVGDTSRLPAQP